MRSFSPAAAGNQASQTAISEKQSTFLSGLALLLASLLALPLVLPSPVQAQNPSYEELAQEVEIRRTDYGVPHIKGENLRAAAFGLGYAQVEDYGEDVARALLTARGERSRVFGADYLDSDFRNQQRHARAVETYHKLPADVRAVKEGFAAGVNHYIRTHSEHVEDWMEPIFTGYDVAARDIGWANPNSVSSFVSSLEDAEDDRVAPQKYHVPEEEIEPERDNETPPREGSNSWALAPSRTTSGNAILLRNPHLSWEAGYYEVQFEVPGEVNFYGDFRVGGPFTTIGGFNEHLGFSTTNNNPHTHEIYALKADSSRVDHYMFDGASIPIKREMQTVHFKTGDGLAKERRERLYTHFGPVVHRGNGWVYVLKTGDHGEYRRGEQLLDMIRATSYEEWEEAMRIRARPRSNFLYADREGNAHYISTGVIPDLPHHSGGDSLAIPASTSDEVYSELIPYDDLPALKNPEGGYVRNENDPFHFTNLHEPISADDYPSHFEDPLLRLRSLHGLEMLHNDRQFSLEDVVEAKHSMRMLLAERVKDDLLRAVRAQNPDGEVEAAARLLEDWDDTVAADARGAVLFRNWWYLYRNEVRSDVRPAEEDPEVFREPWTKDDPLHTPRGLAHPDVAAEKFAEAVESTAEERGSWDVPWGEVHRARLGDKDLPVGGCTGSLGCFRVLWFTDDDDDDKRRIRGGDGWTFAVEFGETPRAYSILAYGQSNREDSPHNTDQLEMFVNNEMKPVFFTEEDIQENIIRSYHPGEEEPFHVEANN